MKDIPQDIERTIWAIAESNDPRAIDEFGVRYPAYKSELVERIQLVRSLKASRPMKEPPRLNLPQKQPSRSFGRGFSLVLAGAAVFTVAVATVITINAKQPAKQEKPYVSEERTNALMQDQRVAKQGGPIKQEGSEVVNPETNTTEASKAPLGPFERLVQLDHKEARLSNVIREIAQQARLSLDFAPGFEEQTIAARYVDVPAKEALDDLGQNFGFTVMIQEGNKAIVVPAIDPSRPPVTVPDGSFSEPKESKSEDPNHQRLKNSNLDGQSQQKLSESGKN